MVTKYKNPLFFNILWSLLAKVFAMVFYFCADVFYARTLGVAKYAEWVFFFSIAHMAFYIGWFGINTSAKVHITRGEQKDNCLGAGLIVRTIFSTIILLIAFFTAPFIACKTGYPQPYPELKELMYILCGMIFFNSFTEFFKHLYIGTQEFKKLFFVTAIEYFLYCLFTLLLLVNNNNPVSIAIGYCAAGAVLLLVNLAMTMKKYDLRLICKGMKNRQLQKKIIGYALPLVITSIGGLILMEMDTFMLGLLGTERQVAMYSIAKQLVSKATNVNMAIWAGSVASLAVITKENLGDRIRNFKNVNRLNNVAALFISACFLLFGKVAISFVYGNEYRDASKILVLLIPYYLFYCISSLYANFLDFMGRAKIRAFWFVSVIVINIFLNYLLIPIYGAFGAAIATIVSLIPYTFYCLCDVRNIFKNTAFNSSSR